MYRLLTKESIIIVFFKKKILQKSTKLLQRKITLSLCKGPFSYWKFQINKPLIKLHLTLCYSYEHYVSNNLYDRRVLSTLSINQVCMAVFPKLYFVHKPSYVQLAQLSDGLRFKYNVAEMCSSPQLTVHYKKHNSTTTHSLVEVCDRPYFILTPDNSIVYQAKIKARKMDG